MNQLLVVLFHTTVVCLTSLSAAEGETDAKTGIATEHATITYEIPESLDQKMDLTSEITFVQELLRKSGRYSFYGVGDSVEGGGNPATLFNRESTRKLWKEHWNTELEWYVNRETTYLDDDEHSRATQDATDCPTLINYPLQTQNVPRNHHLSDWMSPVKWMGFSVSQGYAICNGMRSEGSRLYVIVFEELCPSGNGRKARCIPRYVFLGNCPIDPQNSIKNVHPTGSVFRIDSDGHLLAYDALDEGAVVGPQIRWNADGSIQSWTEGVQNKLIETDPTQIWCPLLLGSPKYLVPFDIRSHYYIQKSRP